MTVRFSSISVVTGPAIEPVTLAEAKAHLRMDGADNDSTINSLIKAAREDVEGDTRRALITQTLDVSYQYFGSKLELPRGPLQSVTSVKYYDTDGVEQTLDTTVYRVTTKGNLPSIITLDYGQEWPSLYDIEEPITIRIVTGFGATADTVPEPLRQAILLDMERGYEGDIKRDAGLQQMYADRIRKWVISY